MIFDRSQHVGLVPTDDPFWRRIDIDVSYSVSHETTRVRIRVEVEDDRSPIMMGFDIPEERVRNSRHRPALSAEIYLRLLRELADTFPIHAHKVVRYFLEMYPRFAGEAPQEWMLEHPWAQPPCDSGVDLQFQLEEWQRRVAAVYNVPSRILDAQPPHQPPPPPPWRPRRRTSQPPAGQALAPPNRRLPKYQPS